MINTKSTKLVLICLIVSVFMDQAGIFIIYPVIPSLLMSITGNSVVDNAIIGGWLIATYGLMQFIFAPIMGSVSDRFGRKPVLVLCFLAFSLDYLLLAIANNLYLLFVARIISGIAGSSIIVSMAGIADISNKDNKTKNYAYLFAAMSLGMILGPAISSLGLSFGMRVPFILASILSFFCLLMIVLFFKETLSTENRRDFTIQNPIGNIIYFSKYKGFIYLLLACFIFNLTFQFPLSLWSFFTKYRFSWSDQEIAHSFIVLGTLLFLVQSILVGRLYPILGNNKICYLGFSMFALGLTAIALATNSYWFYLALIIYSLSSISNSSMTSIYSSRVGLSEQGQLMGTIAAITSICNVVGPVIASYTYRFSVNLHLPLSDGYPFILAAVVTLLVIPILYKGFSVGAEVNE